MACRLEHGALHTVTHLYYNYWLQTPFLDFCGHLNEGSNAMLRNRRKTKQLPQRELEPFYASIFGGSQKFGPPPKSIKNLFLVEKKWGGPEFFFGPTHFFSTRNKILILFGGVQIFGTPPKMLA